MGATFRRWTGSARRRRRLAGAARSRGAVPPIARGAGVAAGLAFGLGCAGPPRQYTLRIDVANQDNTRLCHRDAEAGGGRGDAQCEPFGAQSLHTPSTLTVALDHQAAGLKYDLRIAQFSREAGKADVQSILDGFTQRVATVIGAAGGTADGGKLLSDAAGLMKSQAPAVAAAVANRAGAAGQAPPLRAPGGVFRPVNGKLPPASELRASSPLTWTNAPARPPLPFPRAVSIDDADVKALPAGITLEDVAASVAEWCSADSFVQAADRPRWTAVYKALDADPDPRAVSERLAPSAGDIVQYLVDRGGTDPLATVIEPLITAGDHWASAPDASPDPAAREFYLMRLGKTVQANLKHCDDNIRFLKARGVKTDLDGAARSAGKLRDAADRHAKAFDDVFRPLLQGALVGAERTLDATSGSTTITLEPGQLELGVGVTAAGGSRAEIATYKVKTTGIERLAVLIAPAFTVCWTGCFDRYEQVAQQPAMAGGAAHSVLDRTHLWYNFSVVTALHVTAYSWDDWGVGATFGYPIGTPRDTSSNFVIGAGLRHSSGLEVAAGLHAMLSKGLKASYTVPLDLGTTGNENLTVDNVTTDVPRLGIFILVGFAPGVLTALSNK